MPASRPLFDLSKIDLKRIAVRREEMERYIPHRGAMFLLDGIVWHNSVMSEGVAVKHVRDDEFWVPGHIPGRPLMPGVLMIECGAQLASYLYYKRSGVNWFAGFTRIEDVEFRGQVVPGDTFYVLCKEVKFNIKRFITEVQGMVNGQVIFQARIHGMAFPGVGELRPVGESLVRER